MADGISRSDVAHSHAANHRARRPQPVVDTAFLCPHCQLDRAVDTRLRTLARAGQTQELEWVSMHNVNSSHLDGFRYADSKTGRTSYTRF